MKHWLNSDQAATILKSDRDSFYSRIEKLKKNESYIFNLPHPRLIRKLDIAVTKAYDASFSIYLRLQVAPLDILDNHKTEAVFELTAANTKAFYDGLDNLLQERFDGYSFINKDCKQWDVNYIEYSANLYSPNVDLAIEMLRKNTKDVKAKSFKNEYGDTLSISRKAKHRRNSSTTVYNKAEAVKALHEADYSELKDDVDGYIRYERQLGREYLWTMVAKKDESKDNLDYYLNNSIARHILAVGYSAKFATGDFYSLQCIRDYVKNKKFVEYAESATRSRSIKCTKNNSKRGKGLSTATNNARIKAFDKMGIAPIAIPTRYKTDVLFNPIPRDWLTESERINKTVNFFKYSGIKFDTSTNTITHIKGA